MVKIDEAYIEDVINNNKMNSSLTNEVIRLVQKSLRHPEDYNIKVVRTTKYECEVQAIRKVKYYGEYVSRDTITTYRYRLLDNRNWDVLVYN